MRSWALVFQDPIAVRWNGQLAGCLKDVSSPWLSGRFGFRQGWSRSVRWENLTVNASSSLSNIPIASYDDYYPLGMQMEMRSGNAGSTEARYKYTGKERDVETGYDYFGARYYDARIGRWMSMDQLAHKYPGWSPYTYVFDNPLNGIDQGGMFVVKVIGQNTPYERVEATRFNEIELLVHMSFEMTPVALASAITRKASGDPSVTPTWEEETLSALAFGVGPICELAHSIYTGVLWNMAIDGIGLASGLAGFSEVGADSKAFLAANKLNVDGTQFTQREMIETATPDGRGGFKDYRVSQPTNLGSLTLNPELLKKWGRDNAQKNMRKILEAAKFRLRHGFSLDSFTVPIDDVDISVTSDK